MKRIIFSFAVVAAITLSAVVGLASCGNIQTREEGGSSKVERWEYKIVSVSSASINSIEDQKKAEAEFNRLGAEGWEMVSSVDTGAGRYHISGVFKRRLQ